MLKNTNIPSFKSLMFLIYFNISRVIEIHNYGLRITRERGQLRCREKETDYNSNLWLCSVDINYRNRQTDATRWKRTIGSITGAMGTWAVGSLNEPPPLGRFCSIICCITMWCIWAFCSIIMSMKSETESMSKWVWVEWPCVVRLKHGQHANTWMWHYHVYYVWNKAMV